ncbi:carbohydrate ABC transporter permease [Rhizobium rhizoryzae]|uniref:Multiple sugar transport system permease protein n=1 Tax=Rhizobium rhizoryzae TaxID=451876 RepID=A0A7W6LLS7_9HYPH|nr:sugar ABC transporter permease [Rhizobium rhizoryzae]MBB4145748.1 multiple sugar transport system permease protein [Rhizobium rhizoryzae]
MAPTSMIHEKPMNEIATSRFSGWWVSFKPRLTPYLFIAPNLILFSVFIFFPLLYAAFISVHEWSLIDEPLYVGAENYTRLLTDYQFWQAMKNTVIYSVATVPTSLAIGLMLAIGLNRDLFARTLLRSVYFLPVVVSSVATAIIAAWLFNDHYGVINALLKLIGISPISWLSTTTWALPSIILTTLWTRVGFCMVVYLAALQSISPTYYEAASIDGATRFQQFRHVTWPMLRPTTFLLLILNVIHSFQVFDLIYVMTGGGPGFSTTMIVQYIYQSAFATSEMGYASAMGIILFLLILLFTLLQWRVNKRTEEFV